jgi:hypothetical protein
MYLLTLGITWVILHLYIRFYVERPSYILEDIKPNITYKHYIFFTAFILLHIILVIMMIVTIYRQKFPREKSSILIYLSERITPVVNAIYWKPLDFLHDLIAPHIPMSGKFFVYVEKTWSNKKPWYFYALLILFEILPKCIIAFTFLIEVTILGQIRIFLYCISLILIVILWHIFLKLFANFGIRNMPVIKEYFLTIKGVGEPTLDEHGTIIGYNSYEFIVKPEYETVIDIEEEARLLLQLEAMPRFVRS